jgi:uncharacterized membrane protein YgdD (TMEM256/DUF423 family)
MDREQYPNWLAMKTREGIAMSPLAAQPVGIASRLFGALAGLLGATGVAGAAMASHAAAGPASALALIALTHAPVFLVFAAWPVHSVWPGAARAVLAAGTIGFVTDMALRLGFGFGLGPLAPVFGSLMIAGWLFVGVSCVFRATR